MVDVDTAALLQTIADSISVVRDGAPPGVGEPLRLTITPRATEIKLPALDEGSISLTWLAEHVRSVDPLAVRTEATETAPPQTVESYLADSTKVIGAQPVADIGVTLAGPPLKDGILPTVGTPVGSSKAVDLPTVEPSAIPSTSPDDLLSGVPGLLGQATARVPVPILAPVAITVAWTVERFDNGWVPIDTEVRADGTRDFLAFP